MTERFPRKKVATPRPAPRETPFSPATVRTAPRGLALNLSWFTVEAALYLGLLLLAAALRLHDLTAAPLGSDEGARAWSAWRLLRGEDPAVWQDPALVLVGSGVFLLLGASDLVVRLLPALAGLGLVAGCWWLRPYLGRGETLLAAFLLAVSPLAVYYSRSFSPEVFAAVLSLALIVCVLSYLRQRRPAYLVIGSALLGLLLLLGAPGAQMVLTLGAFVAVRLTLGRDPALEGVTGWLKAGGWSTALGVLVGTLFLGSSGLLVYPKGLGLPGLGAWIAQFSLEAGGQPWHYHLQLLVAYEALITVLGLAGAGVIAWRWRHPEADRLATRGEPDGGAATRSLLCNLLLFWAAASLVLLLATGRKSSGQTLALLLPLALLGGVGAAGLLRRLDLEAVVRIIPFVLVIGVAGGFAFLVVGFITHPMLEVLNLPWLRSPLLVLSVVILAAVAVLYRRHLGREELPALAAFGLIVLLAFSLRGATRLSLPGGPELLAPAPAGDVGRMARRADEVYWRLRGMQEVKTLVDSSVQHPFAWYLREQPNVAFAPRVEPGATIVIARGAEPDGRFARYLVERGRLTGPTLGGPLSLGRLWRWWIYDEGERVEGPPLFMYIGG